MQSTLQFYGGTGTVTGSNFLLRSNPDQSGGTKVNILVDCGLTQGKHTAELDNWAAFPYEPASVQYLVVTHAHIDHIGRIPKLVKDGFRGKIISTKATMSLVEPLLLDSMELLAHDARKHGRLPLYDTGDITNAMGLWEGIGYHQKVALPGNFVLEFFDAGHILGSAMAVFTREGNSIAFTGDLGGGNSPLLPPVEEIPHVNYLVMESVYGDRVRSTDQSRRDTLENVIEDTAARNGTLLIPAFSTERTQDLLFEIRTLMVEKRVPSMPVYADSPLAQKITASYLAHPEYFAPAIRARLEDGENIFAFPELHFVESAEESRGIQSTKGPMIIIAGSGMSNGGRVHSHEKNILPDEKSTLLIVGYQSAGSLGRRLVEGDKNVRIMGQPTPVRCRVEAIYGYSAHMDSQELLEFANKAMGKIKEVFVVMGEPASSSFLAQRIRDYLGTKATVPELGSTVILNV